MRSLIFTALVFCGGGAFAEDWSSLPLEEIAKTKVTLLKEIKIEAKSIGTFFQEGQPVHSSGAINYKKHICFISLRSRLDDTSTPGFIPRGTEITFARARPIIGRLDEFGKVTEGPYGYQFDSTDPGIFDFKVEPFANWILGVKEIQKNPSLMNAEVARKCFGDYVKFEF